VEWARRTPARRSRANASALLCPDRSRPIVATPPPPVALPALVATLRHVDLVAVARVTGTVPCTWRPVRLGRS